MSRKEKIIYRGERRAFVKGTCPAVVPCNRLVNDMFHFAQGSAEMELGTPKEVTGSLKIKTIH